MEKTIYMGNTTGELRQLPAQQERMETGPVQFGTDWPGLFLRGDFCIAFSMHLRALLEQPEDLISRSMATSLIQILESALVRPVWMAGKEPLK